VSIANLLVTFVGIARAPVVAVCFLYNSQFRIRRRAVELECACERAYISVKNVRIHGGGTRNNHSSSSLLGASSAASRALRALEMSLAPSSFSAPSLLPRAGRFQSPMTIQKEEGEGATHERECILTLWSSFQEVGVSSPGPASGPNSCVWVQYSIGPVQGQELEEGKWGKYFVVSPLDGPHVSSA